MMSDQMMSSGVYVVQVWADLLSAGQIEVRAGLSDGHFLLLNRTDEDLALMMKRLVDGFLDDRTTLSSNLLTGVLRVRAADQISDDQVKTLELNKLLQTLIKLPHKFSQSEAVRDFFKPSAVDQIFIKDQDHSIPHEDQEVDQSIGYEDQEADQSILYEDQEEGRSIRHEDQEECRSIRHEDQEVDQSILYDDQEVDQSIGYEDQEVDQSIGYEDQEVDQSIMYEDQEEGRSIRREDQEVDQSILYEDHEEGRSIRHEDQEVDQSIMYEDLNLEIFQSPVISQLSEILRSNGFCLANTETILFDLTPPTQPVTQSEDSRGRRASVGPAVCLQLCHPSVSPHLRGFTGMMGRLKRRSFRNAPPPGLPPSTCCTPGRRRQNTDSPIC